MRMRCQSSLDDDLHIRAAEWQNQLQSCSTVVLDYDQCFEFRENSLNLLSNSTDEMLQTRRSLLMLIATRYRPNAIISKVSYLLLPVLSNKSLISIDYHNRKLMPKLLEQLDAHQY